MKKSILMIGAAIAGGFAGMMLRECERPSIDYKPPGEAVRDTVTFVDTIPYLLPTPANERAIGTKIVYVPVFSPKDQPADAEQDSTDCAYGEGCDMIALHDSVAVEIPITQREYEAEEYHAWVSGYDPKLDSIFVFPRREVVTIREPHRVDNWKPKRWGIGVFAGYGYTPQGFQPCAGISVNYNLWNF